MIGHGRKGSFRYANKLSKDIDSTFDGVFQLLLLILEGSLLVMWQSLSLSGQLLATLSDSSRQCKQLLIVIGVMCQFLKRSFIHC